MTIRSFGRSADGASNTAMEVPIKYCKSCNIWRPPRAHHCRICDACTETQDHHCVWLNNCVGRRNYRYFFTFIASGTLIAFFLLAASIAHIGIWMDRNHTSFREAVSHDWTTQGAMAMFIYGVLIFPYPASLWGYHVFLMARGESTREYLNSHKFLKKDRHRPFSQHNIFKNIVSVLSRPRPPTYMRFKQRYEEGDLRLGGQRTARGVKPKDDHGEGSGALEMKKIDGGDDPQGFQGPAGRRPLHNPSRGGAALEASEKA